MTAETFLLKKLRKEAAKANKEIAKTKALTKNSNPIEYIDPTLEKYFKSILEGAGFNLSKANNGGIREYFKNKEELEKRIEREKLRKELVEKYGEGNIFHWKDIYEVKMKYIVELDYLSKYKGNLCPELPMKLREFEDKYRFDFDIHNDATPLGTNYRILAPLEALDIEIKTDPILSEINANAILLLELYGKYRGFYMLVYSWGERFSIFRRILAWRRQFV